MIKHGAAIGGRLTPEYVAWRSMISRCYYPKANGYERYGGRGIKICDRWRWSFTNFITDMGMRPSAKHSIERVDNEGNYEPSNCRWATEFEQHRNQRSNRWFTLDGITMCASDWAAKLNIPKGTVATRIHRGQLSADDVFSPPRLSKKVLVVNNVERTLLEWATISGQSPNLIHHRIQRGWNPESAIFTQKRQYKKER